MDHPASSATIMVPGDTPVELRHDTLSRTVTVRYADGHVRKLHMEDEAEAHEAQSLFHRLNS